MAYTKEEYDQMKVIVEKLAEMDAQRDYRLAEATQMWMEEACELYSGLSRKLRGKEISSKSLEHELHDTLWGLTGISRLILKMIEDDGE